MTTSFRAVCLGILYWVAGCGGSGVRVATYLPMDEAAGLVNRNCEGFSGRLYVQGRWKGQLRDGAGVLRRLEGGFKLHVSGQDRVCFKAGALPLTGRLFEAGCNESECWYWQQYELDALRIGRRGDFSADVEGVVVCPEMLTAALGLSRIDLSGAGGPMYRVEDDYHQLIYGSDDAEGRLVISREVWLGRYAPFQVERVVYRGADGRVVMESRLSGHGPVLAGGPVLAREADIFWPLSGGAIHLTLQDVRLYDDVDHISFVSPLLRRERQPGYPESPPGKVITIND